VIVLDSVGIGGAPDAAAYGDEGANTLGHLLDRDPSLRLPALWELGLGRILGRGPEARVRGSYGRMREQSAGKDSTTGHWEIAGVVLEEPFRVFARFPDDLVRPIEQECGVEFLGNLAASGTQIIEDLGKEHVRTGKPILYTSADSVLQIAAHEEVIRLERLYEICRTARRHADRFRIGRVIARPFVGDPAGRAGAAATFARTPNRHDFSMRPPRTVLDALTDSGVPVCGIGKTSDLFAGRGITRSIATATNRAGMAKIEEVWPETERGLIFANLVDFDTVYGHRRDPDGYAAALGAFDDWLGGFLEECRPEDLVIITADHGNDPTFRGTDHTRELTPVMVRHGDRAENLGQRETFADVGATLAMFFEIEPWPTGEPFAAIDPTPRRESGRA
jgi:phosphopentomutase